MAVPNEELLSSEVIYARRIEMISRHINIETSAVLEIGAFDRPTFLPRSGDSFFLDYMSQLELIDKGAHIGRNIEKIPKMDYVIKSNKLSVEVDRRFDLIVANHVIEHVPNPIEWLCEINAILEDDGHLFLSIPDRRYTFDYLRKETDFLEMISRFRSGYSKPDFWKLAEVRLLERPQITGEAAWHKDILDDLLAQGGLNVLEAMEKAEDESRRAYIDIHCNVFTYASFCELFRQLDETGISPLELAEIEDVMPGKIEFHAILRKRASFDTSNIERLLSVIPPLNQAR